MITTGISIRTIEPADNAVLATIIKDVMTELGINKPGTVFFDPTTDALYQLFQRPEGTYFVATAESGELLGGAGIYPSDGLPDGVCELVKMYLKKEMRGKGLGRFLIDKCLAAAKEMGYRQVYLESMPELKKAVSVYEKFGFTHLTGPMGNTGHFGCDIWMIKDL
jgi:putative acetyltransferase